MHVFATGASGYLGTALVADLVAAGHTVTGLASSPGGAERIAAAGGTALTGALQDTALLARAAEQADAVAHLAWAAPGAGVDPAAVDLAAIRALGDALAGSGRRLVVASGVLGLRPGAMVTEAAAPSAATSPVAAARAANGRPRSGTPSGA